MSDARVGRRGPRFTEAKRDGRRPSSEFKAQGLLHEKAADPAAPSLTETASS